MSRYGKTGWYKYYLFLSSIFFDPRKVIYKIKALPFFVTNLVRYLALARQCQSHLRVSEFMYTSDGRFDSAGSARGHYFHQDLWAAKWLSKHGVTQHMDVGSRVDGFVAHILPFCKVCYIDLRPMDIKVSGLEFRQGSITNIPFPDDSISTLSSLHVIEHIGLGRYGDPVDPDGYLKAAQELTRVLKCGGTLLLGTPVGRERIVFDAHRVFDPYTVVRAFPNLTLEEFFLIDDHGAGVVENATLEQGRACEYGCGLFIFRKQA